MFRKMRRYKQEISREECIKILKEQPRGILSIEGLEGYPYGMPLNHWYDEKTGNLYFHGAKEGHRMDALEKNDKVSFCVYDQGYRKDGKWPLYIHSVIVFGRMKKITDPERTIEVCRSLSLKFTDERAYIDREEIKKSLPHVLCWELEVVHMSGKLVKES